MARTISYFFISLLTFLFGVALYSSYRFGAELFSQDAGIRSSVQLRALDHQESQIRLRLGIFAGVDGVTFSTDNSRFNLFDDYRDRETAITVSPDELSDIVDRLVAAGLLEESHVNAPFFISLPVANTIMIAWPDRVRQFTWVYGDECRVPEKYLSLLEEVNARHRVTLLKAFITYNRRPRSSS
jgi:hypothetical protein